MQITLNNKWSSSLRRGLWILSLSESESLRIIIDMLKMYARLLNVIAEVEENSGKRFDELLKELFSPAKLAGLYNKLPPDVYGEFMAVLLRLASLSSTVQNPMILPVDEKRRVASELADIASSLEKLIGRLGELNGGSLCV